jgi:hypothetical protein
MRYLRQWMRVRQNNFKRGFSRETIKALAAHGILMPEELLFIPTEQIARISFDSAQSASAEVRAYRAHFLSENLVSKLRSQCPPMIRLHGTADRRQEAGDWRYSPLRRPIGMTFSPSAGVMQKVTHAAMSLWRFSNSLPRAGECRRFLNPIAERRRNP